MANRIVVDMYGVHIAGKRIFKGQLDKESGKMREDRFLVQGWKEADDGWLEVTTFRAKKDLWDTIEAKEVLNLEVSIGTFKDQIYTDIVGVKRPVATALRKAS